MDIDGNTLDTGKVGITVGTSSARTIKSDVVEMCHRFNIRLHEKDEKLMPTKSFETDAGFDLRGRAYCSVENGVISKEMELTAIPIMIAPNEIMLIKTGVFIELRRGWEAQIRPRSGLALKNGITMTNSPGTVDASYRNEVGVILQNTSDRNFNIQRYDRIAQMVLKEIPNVLLTVVDELDVTDRNMGGFGSTGAK